MSFLRLAPTLLTGLALASFLASGAPAPNLRALAEREKAPLLKSLEEFVAIESGSRDLEGLTRLATLLSQRFRDLGAAVELVDVDAEAYRMNDTPARIGPVLRATLKGTGRRSILLLAHLDTVYPRGTIAKQPFRLDGDRVYGVGIADCKHGVAVILHTVRLLQQLNVRDYRTLTVLINADEELGSPGSRHLITRLGAEHDAVLSFEAPIGSDCLIIATSGIASATLRVQGRGSHAGVAPEKGVNSLYELSHLILQTRDLSEPEHGLKMNWTMAQAGVTRNMIPPEATALADIRVLRVEDYDRIERKIRERLTRQLLPESKVTLEFERRRPPLEPSPISKQAAAQAQAIYRELGLTLVVEDKAEGGGTDAAFAALNTRAPVLERLGLVGFGPHSTNDEYILASSIVPRLYLATRLITELSRSPAP